MIYEQPVCYEFKNIRVPTLLIVGKADRTIVGKDKLSKQEQDAHGQYPQLAKLTQAEIKNSQLRLVDGVGHIPHIQDLTSFEKYVAEFLRRP
jgi:pimeloyl-ACP methyl ester carboxylesterase